MELLDLLRLPRDYHSKRIQQCSGGEKQRVALARALAFDPEILFFDEPLSALDYRLRKALEKELKELHNRTGKTFVYITHSLEEAMVMSDRIAIMRAGRFEQIAPADEIYARPVSRFVAEFMGEVNLFDIRRTAEGIAAGALEIAPDVAAHIGLPEGGHGALMVRPEAVRFLAPGETDEIMLRGHLHSDYLLGSRVQHQIDLADGSAATIETLREDRHTGVPGAPVTLGWPLSSTHLIRED